MNLADLLGEPWPTEVAGTGYRFVCDDDAPDGTKPWLLVPANAAGIRSYMRDFSDAVQPILRTVPNPDLHEASFTDAGWSDTRLARACWLVSAYETCQQALTPRLHVV